ncbi:MAG: hypothetical protein DYG94_01620 [Leptolyngbya sp. PLA3]|nr:hypothetical protein [Leptolyngbya sp. PL-A3]
MGVLPGVVHDHPHQLGAAGDAQGRPDRAAGAVGGRGGAGRVHSGGTGQGGAALSTNGAHPHAPRRWAPWAARPTSVLWLVALVTLARIIYLVWICPYTLVEDEAHYWEWSRHLDWSYYSKGPGVAWVIALSTSLFGHVEWAVRLPAVLASAIGSLAVADAAVRVSGDRRSGFVAAVLYQCVPPFLVVSLLMVLAGAAVGVGFIFKYTIVLAGVGLLIALAGKRPGLVRRHWLGAGVMVLLGLLPVAIWNTQHDWATVRHLLGHLGLPGGDLPPTQGNGGWHYNPVWTLEYLGMLLVAGPVVVLGALVARRRWKELLGVRVLAWASMPVLLFYLMVSFLAETEGNWAMGGFVGLIPLCSLPIPGAIERRFIPVRACWRITIASGLVTGVFFVFLPILARSPRFGHLVPVDRLTGMRAFAVETEAEMETLRRASGLEPFLVSSHYGRASQLAFYMPGRPTVYCASSFAPDSRRTQYDLWPETDLHRPEVRAALLGRPALLFGGPKEFWERAFDEVVDIGELPSEPKKGRSTYQGWRFHGFEPIIEPSTP